MKNIQYAVELMLIEYIIGLFINMDFLYITNITGFGRFSMVCAFFVCIGIYIDFRKRGFL